jgi:hypothetical protein
MKKTRYALLCVSLVAIAQSVDATTLQYTTYSSWSAQVTGTPTFVDVETLPSGSYSTAGGVTDASYIFTGPDGAGWSLGVQTFGSKSGLYGPNDGMGGIQVTMPGSGQSAIYFYANTESNNTLTNGSLTLTLSDGEIFSIFSGQFGLSISHPITSYNVTTSAGQAAFLQWAYFGNSSLPQDGGGTGSNPGQAPEAATIALVGGGILVLFGSKRKLIRKFAV